MENTTPTTNSLENYFLPFTANKDFKKEPRLLDRGEGVYYWNHKGDQVIDASSGLFCVPLGHLEIHKCCSSVLYHKSFFTLQ